MNNTEPPRPASLAAAHGSPDEMQPELKIKSLPIDLELCELLGDKPSDFIVVCFDGVQLDDFGTPYDSPRARVERQGLVDRLNDRSSESLWPELWKNWKPNICKQFGLPDTTKASDYRPVVSIQISRVCPGYSEHLHSAIRLFETLADKIETWTVTQGVDCRVTVINKHRQTFVNLGSKPSLVIAETVRELLKANLENAGTERTAADK